MPGVLPKACYQLLIHLIVCFWWMDANLQADHPGDLLQLYTYWVALAPSSPLAPMLPTRDDIRLMALALLRLQDVYDLPARQVFV